MDQFIRLLCLVITLALLGCGSDSSDNSQETVINPNVYDALRSDFKSCEGSLELAKTYQLILNDGNNQNYQKQYLSIYGGLACENKDHIERKIRVLNTNTEEALNEYLDNQTTHAGNILQVKGPETIDNDTDYMVYTFVNDIYQTYEEAEKDALALAALIEDEVDLDPAKVFLVYNSSEKYWNSVSTMHEIL